MKRRCLDSPSPDIVEVEDKEKAARVRQAKQAPSNEAKEKVAPQKAPKSKSLPTSNAPQDVKSLAEDYKPIRQRSVRRHNPVSMSADIRA